MSTNATYRPILAVGSLMAGLGVAAGAFGAHMLKSTLDPAMLAVYDTAARYQLFHAIGMVLVGLAMKQLDDRTLATAGWLFAAGLLLFCGSLYGMALFGLKWLGPLTPLGGLAFIAGWMLFAWKIWRRRT